MGLKYLLILYLSSKLLAPSEFGMFSLFLVILNFAYLFIGFGIIDTGMYLLSKNNSKELTGAIFIFTCVISFIFIMVLIAILYYYKFEHYLLIAILSGGYIVNLFVKRVSIGMHDKFSMYYFEFFMYLVTIILVVAFAGDVYSSIFLYLIGMLLVSAIFIVRLRPKFTNLAYNLKYLMENIRVYGIRVHFSQFIAMGTYDLDKIMLEYMFGYASVGIYNLALNFIMPVKLFSMSISEMLFKDFSKQKKIKKEIFLLNTSISLVLSIILSIAGYFIIIMFYDKEYFEILEYIFLLPILALLSSFYVPVNNFFSAKGLARQKFINAIILAICNVAFNSLFIPNYGVSGAIIATILALLFNNILFVYQYWLFIKQK